MNDQIATTVRATTRVAPTRTPDESILDYAQVSLWGDARGGDCCCHAPAPDDRGGCFQGSGVSSVTSRITTKHKTATDLE